jgi:altronate dehydratase large subunit
VFLGYLRTDGRVGVRNHVLVVPTVICSAVVAERIAASIAPIGTALPHLAGCGQLGPDLHVTHDTLAAYCRHPERRRRHRDRAGLRAARRPVSRRHRASIGQARRTSSRFKAKGGTVRATARGIEIARRLADGCQPHRSRAGAPRRPSCCR